MIIKRIYKIVIPHTIRDKLNLIKSKYISYRITKNFQNCSFKITKYGNLNPNYTFFVINDSNPKAGLLSEWFCFMAAIRYAETNNLIPIIDLKNYYMNTICNKSDIGKRNAWDFFFEQPNNNYTLDDVYKSKNVIICPTVWNGKLAEYSIRDGNKDILTELTDFQKKQYTFFYNKCPLKRELLDKAQELYESLFPKNKRVLGVSFRRAYERHHYWKDPTTPEGTHLVKFTLKNIIPKIKEILLKDNYESLFLLCDDREANEEIKKEFKEKCIVYERPLPHYFENGKPIPVDYDKDYDLIFKEFTDSSDSVTKRNIDYLIAIFLLSKCNSILSGGGTADLFAYIINDYNFEKIY